MAGSTRPTPSVTAEPPTILACTQTVGGCGAPAYPQKWGLRVGVRTLLRSGLLLQIVALRGLGLEDAAEQDLVGGPGLVDDDGVRRRAVEREGPLLGPRLRVG